LCQIFYKVIFFILVMIGNFFYFLPHSIILAPLPEIGRDLHTASLAVFCNNPEQVTDASTIIPVSLSQTLFIMTPLAHTVCSIR
jgi:hypothetical protein